MALKNEDVSKLGAKFLWTDDPRRVNLGIKVLGALCVVLLLLDLVIHRHSYFSIEKWIGFYSITGFVAFSVIVIAAKNLRRIIRRDETYYADKAVDSEGYPAEGLGLSDTDAGNSQ